MGCAVGEVHFVLGVRLLGGRAARRRLWIRSGSGVGWQRWDGVGPRPGSPNAGSCQAVCIEFGRLLAPREGGRGKRGKGRTQKGGAARREGRRCQRENKNMDAGTRGRWVRITLQNRKYRQRAVRHRPRSGPQRIVSIGGGGGGGWKAFVHHRHHR